MKRILAVMAAIIALSMPMAFAYDADNPYTVTLQYIIPIDSSFSVETRSLTAEIKFEFTAKTESNLEPTGQDDGNSLEILNVTNDGNTAIDLYHNTTIPTLGAGTVALCVDTDNTVDGCTNLTDSMVQLTDELAIDGHVDVYMWANAEDASSGIHTGKYQINSTVD